MQAAAHNLGRVMRIGSGKPPKFNGLRAVVLLGGTAPLERFKEGGVS